MRPQLLVVCCRDCFRAFYVHKFRAVLGKNRLIFPGEKVVYGMTLLQSPPWALAVSPCLPSQGRSCGGCSLSSNLPSLLGAPGVVWGAFIKLHGLAGP